jgi:hypothetical protein
MEATTPLFWRKCSTCKKPIGLGTKYYVCSVSTCNGQRTGYVFCSVHCFEGHLPAARHRDAGAVEKTAPMTPYHASEPGSPALAEAKPASRVFATQSSTLKPSPPGSAATGSAVRDEVLVIASRLKDYIHARSEYNTSQSVMEVLSQHLRVLCDRAIDHARSEGRKTVMDRDFEFLKKL